ncbi:Integrase zinc binding domain [Popillia japonica]|uniref:Integrase zinc binding domain n=1 Tax=Popillia japonica TaxID=7064 RepID=A0AAW1KSS7_POPJA
MEKLTWDEPVPTSIQTKWTSYRYNLSKLNDLQIPRYALCAKPTHVEIHGFSDASLQGYGACIYLRSIDQQHNISTIYVEIHGFSDASLQRYGACIYLRSVDQQHNISVNLLCSKTKVAPLKPITIPKLELCAALLLSKLHDEVQRSLKLVKSFLWTDSSIVLGWLKTSPNLLKTFVCNRVAQIQELTPECTWRHVGTKCNPADLLSHGVSPDVIKNSTLWWNGPSFLQGDETTWPSSDYSNSALPELKKTVQAFVSIDPEPFPMTNFSRYSRLRQVTAYCFRFAKNSALPRHDRASGPLTSFRFAKNSALPRHDRASGPLTSEELQSASTSLFKIAQSQCFPDELKTLTKSKPLKPSSKLSSLNPFLDSIGIIRVGGRLSNSQFSYDKKHPIILSGKHHLSKLIVTHEHLRLLHAGPQLLLSSLPDKFWIIAGRNIVKKVVHDCIRCLRFSPQSPKLISSG